MFDPNSPNTVLQFAPRMSPEQLKQMAQQHAKDPNGVLWASYALAAQKRQQAAAPQQGPQPTVAQQMGFLPEQQGIGQLPAPNMAQMAGGGLVAFAGDAGSDVQADENPIIAKIRAEALRQGMDPDLAVRMFTTESALNTKAVSPKGAAGLGQLMPAAAKDMGISDEDRFDANKNIPASIGYFMRQQEKYKNPQVAAAAYNWGPGNVDKHLAKNNGALDPTGLPKETAKYLFNLFPASSAQAQTQPPAAAPQGGLPTIMGSQLAAQIPTDGIKAPPTTPEQPRFSYGYSAMDPSKLWDKLSSMAARGGKKQPPVADDYDKHEAAMVNRRLQESAAAQEAAAPGVAGAGRGVVNPYKVDPDAPTPSMPDPAVVKQVVENKLGPERTSKMSNDAMLRFFLNLAAGKSQHFAQNVGDAGINTLNQLAQERKQAADEAYQKSHGSYFDRQATTAEKEQESKAGLNKAQEKWYQQRGDALDTRADQAAAGLTEKEMAAIEKQAAANVDLYLKNNISAIGMTMEQRQALHAREVKRLMDARAQAQSRVPGPTGPAEGVGGGGWGIRPIQ